MSRYLNLLQYSSTRWANRIVIPSITRRLNSPAMAKTTNFDLEIVEDSEPEREELRRVMKEERKRKRQLKRLVGKQKEIEVIEITDGESVATGGSVDVIEVSGV